MARHRKKIIDLMSAIVLLALVALDAMLWNSIFGAAKNGRRTGIYFLPVTQGESALLILPNNVSILTDAGSDAAIVDDLQKIESSGDAPYIDLAIISYPQSTDYAGFESLLDHYQIGAFLYNGRGDITHSADWQKLTDAINAKHIPLITICAGDRIRYGPAAKIEILSPDATFARSPEPSDTGIVQRITTPNLSVLLAADIDVNVENRLLTHGNDIKANILKAPFPGVATASGDAFLRAVAPKTIVVTPGAKNTASAPTKEMLTHLVSSTSATIATTGRGAFLLYNK